MPPNACHEEPSLFASENWLVLTPLAADEVGIKVTLRRVGEYAEEIGPAPA